jgi:hypothetical protein
MSGSLISGGTASREGEAIEERLEFLGGSLNFSVGERMSRLALGAEQGPRRGARPVLRRAANPEFREGPLGVVRARQIQQLRQANDQPAQVLEPRVREADLRRASADGPSRPGSPTRRSPPTT